MNSSSTMSEKLTCDGISDTINRGPGILYIFNHTNFDEFNELNIHKKIKLSKRIGTEYDVLILQESFHNFDIENIVYDDLKLIEIQEKITEISKKDFSYNSCLIIAVLTHGFKNHLLAAKDEAYNFDDIVLEISKNEHLKSKPKIFLLQACRGDINLYNNMVTDGHEVIGQEQQPQYYFCDEKYILHSATEAFTSFRDPIDGSPFIQTFCVFLNKYGLYKTIGDLFTLVRIEVKENSRSIQIPEITTNAVKSYVFGDYCLGAAGVSLQSVQSAISDGPSNAVSIDGAENVVIRKYHTPKVQEIHGSQFSEDTRIKTKKGSLPNFFKNIGFKFKKKTVDNELSTSVDPITTAITEEVQSDKWLKFCPKHIPPNTVVAGIDLDGEIMHVGRAYYKDDLLPGKVFLNRSLIAISYNYQELGLENFEILTGSGYSWVKAERHGSVPINAVRGGWTEYGEILYIGRAKHDGSLTPGKIQLSEHCLYIPFGGREIKLLNYEVLVKS